MLLLMELAIDAEKVSACPYMCGAFTKEILEGLDTGQIVDLSFPKHIVKHGKDVID